MSTPNSGAGNSRRESVQSNQSLLSFNTTTGSSFWEPREGSPVSDTTSMASRRRLQSEEERRLERDIRREEVQARLDAENLLIQQNAARKKKSEKQSMHSINLNKLTEDFERFKAEKMEKIREWESRPIKGKEPFMGSIPEVTTDPLKSSTKKQKDNVALRLFKEDQARQAKKKLEREIAAREEYVTRKRLYEARSNTPPPPYAKSLYNIPEDMQEELDFKRLCDAILSLSDPETTRRRNIYPDVREDYEYVTEFRNLKNWIKSGKSYTKQRGDEVLSEHDSSSDLDVINFPGYYNDLSVEERQNRLKTSANQDTGKKLLKVNMGMRSKVRAGERIGSSSTSDTSDDEIPPSRPKQQIKKRPPVPLPVIRAPAPKPRKQVEEDVSSDWSGPKTIFKGYDYEERKLQKDTEANSPLQPSPPTMGDVTPGRLPLRLRGGGIGSTEGSPCAPGTSAQDTHKDDNDCFTPNIMSDSEFRRLRPLNESDFTPSLKRKKTLEDICALDDTNPGLSHGKALGHSQESRRINTRFSVLISLEKEKKKISVNTVKELLDIKEAYLELIDTMIVENSILEGRLLEARVSEETALIQRRVTLNREIIEAINTPQKENRKKSNKRPQSEPAVTDNASESEGPPKRVTIQERLGNRASTSRAPPSESDMDIEHQPSEGEFQLVTRKKKKKKKKTNRRAGETTDDGATTDGSVGRRTNQQKRKDKIEKLKDVQPPKSFIVDVGESNANDVKKSLWSDVCKNIKAPQISSTRLTRKGQLIVTPSDEATYNALAKLTEQRKDVKKEEPRWPLVTLANTDSSLTSDEIRDAIAIQNPGLNIGDGEAAKHIRPLFKFGARDRATVNWVVMVSPTVFQNILKNRIFIGMTSCWAKERFDYSQCITCLRYGHRSSTCKKGKLTCAHCGEDDHKASVCGKKDSPPTCVNCKQAHSAFSNVCKERFRAVEEAVKRTNYQQ